MAPSAITAPVQQSKTLPKSHGNGPDLPVDHATKTSNGLAATNGKKRTHFVLDRNLHKDFPIVVGGKGNHLFTKDGRVIFDATSGAAVSCLGHGHERINEAVFNQMKTGTPYLTSAFWGCDTVDELCKEIINGTGGEMSSVYLTGSGSEAMEAAVKLARQFYYESDKNTPRVNFIARAGSYHGNTIGALGISGHVARRAPYLPFLMNNVHHISACNAYRQRRDGESDESFVARKASELEAKFQELGPETIIAFVAEPVVGAALGCVPSVPGYLRAMRDVCHKHGALLLLDEVMCGMGRSGTLHAWQGEGVVPDLQTVGKGLGGGYQPVAAVLVSKKVIGALLNGSGQFIHGQTYQGMPVQAAAALEVQRVVREQNLMENVTKQGAYLGERLRFLLGDHPNVGDIRGRGLFWGLEFVENKKTKQAFDPKMQVAQRLHDLAISEPYNMTLYPGTGTVDGISGDHVILAPTYMVTAEEIDYITQTASDVIHKLFEGMEVLV